MRHDSPATRRWHGFCGECKRLPISAFYHLLHAPSLAEALTTIVSAGGDTDTNAAITAPLLAAIEGIASLPPKWLRCVKQANPEYAYLLPD